MAGIPLNPVRAPLRQKRMVIALAHTKAIPSLKHSVLAYIPSTLLHQAASFADRSNKDDLRVTE